MANITKRGNSYRIRVSGGYDSKGKQIIFSTSWSPTPGMTEKQIEKELQRQAVLFEDSCKCRAAADMSRMKFEEFGDIWLTEYAAKRLRPRSLEHVKHLKERTYQAIGHLQINKINTRHIQIFINNLSETGINENTGGGLSPKTQRHYLSFISSVFDYAINMGAVTENPCKAVIMPAMSKKEKECYTIDEAQELINKLLTSAPIKYQAFFILAIYGGFRRGELLGLEWSDISFDDMTISIQRSSLYAPALGVFTDTTKTEQSKRVLKLPQKVFDILKKLRSEQAEQQLSMGDRWENSNRLFLNPNGEPIHPNTPYDWLKRFCEKENIRFLGIHAFRHLNASLLINSGADVRTVAAVLGHSQATTTLNIYAHSFAAAQAAALEAVSSVIDDIADKSDKKA